MKRPDAKARLYPSKKLSPELSPCFKKWDDNGKLRTTSFLCICSLYQPITTPDNSGENGQKCPVQITKALLYQLSYVGERTRGRFRGAARSLASTFLSRTARDANSPASPDISATLASVTECKAGRGLRSAPRVCSGEGTRRPTTTTAKRTKIASDSVMCFS